MSQKYPTQLVTRDVGFLYFTNQTLQTTNAEQSVMGESVKFCLRWNDFESNISTAFKEVREDKDFFDVTIACGDEQIQAHKVILSACSPFFRTVLRNNRHGRPLLYLNGVTYNDIVSVLDFMYHGQVSVAQVDSNSFLAVAEELKVKGLTQTTSDANLKTNQPRPKEQARRQDIQPQTKRRGGSPVPQVVRKSNFNPERFDNENEIGKLFQSSQSQVVLLCL